MSVTVPIRTKDLIFERLSGKRLLLVFEKNKQIVKVSLARLNPFKKTIKNKKLRRKNKKRIQSKNKIIVLLSQYTKFIAKKCFIFNKYSTIYSLKIYLSGIFSTKDDKYFIFMRACFFLCISCWQSRLSLQMVSWCEEQFRHLTTSLLSDAKNRPIFFFYFLDWDKRR